MMTKRLSKTGLALAAALALAGCPADAPGAGATGEAADPPGTVLAIELDGRRTTITVEEVDAWLPTIRLIEPTATLPALRRLALTNICLPVKVGALVDPEAREEARALAQDTYDAIQEGLIELKFVPQMEAAEGPFQEVGLEVWGRAVEMTEGEWSPVFETIGAFLFFRFVQAPEPPFTKATPILIERGAFPYLASDEWRDVIDAAYDRSKLTIVDPEWESIVPAHYVYRMTGESPED